METLANELAEHTSRTDQSIEQSEEKSSSITSNIYTNTNTMELALPAMNLTFQILTHNMWCHYLTTAPNKAHRMESFMQEIGRQNYDVVLLQELFVISVFGMVAGDQLRASVSEEFKKLGYEHQALGTSPPWVFGQTSGLVMFSKHPISTYTERRWYKWDDFGTGKGFFHAEIKIHGQDVHFFNVHLDAHGAAARKEQLKSLVEHLPKPYDANRVIVAGDYNIHKNSDEYNEMMEDFTPRGLRDIYAENPEVTHRSGIVIDHVCASNILELVDKEVVKFVDANGEGVSDHYGIHATFKL